jgi:hypothetical protein
MQSKELQMPDLVQKYENFFKEIEKDSNRTKGINVWHVPNPETGLNDITMIQFDMRMFQKEEVQQQIAAQQAFQTVLNQQAQVLNPSTTVQPPPFVTADIVTPPAVIPVTDIQQNEVTQ